MNDPDSIVVVTEPEFQRAADTFRSAPGLRCVIAPVDEAALAHTIAGARARAAIIGGKPYRDEVYRALGSGGVLARFGVGYDGVDLATATRAGVLCTNTPGVLDQSVAELAIALLMAAARHVPVFSRDVIGGRWAPRQGTEVAGKTLAIIGCGRIGRRTARLARAIGLRAVGVARTACPGGDDVFDRITDDFASAAASAEFISIHVPATAANSRFLDRDRLAACRADAWIINTARGTVIDEAALFDALAAGRPAGAALDVFVHEPYVPVDPARDLRTLPNVILTPHVGSHTADASRRMAERALHNVRLALASRFDALDLLNPEVLSRRGG